MLVKLGTLLIFTFVNLLTPVPFLRLYIYNYQPVFEVINEEIYNFLIGKTYDTLDI